MSNYTESVEQIRARAKEVVDELRRDASAGDRRAAQELLAVAVDATLAVHSLWDAPGFYNPFMVGRMDHKKRHRRMLLETVRKSPLGFFPLLHEVNPVPGFEVRWDNSAGEITPRKQRECLSIVKQREIVNSLRVAPPKGFGRDGHCRYLLAVMLIPWADHVRYGETEGPDYIRRLPQLTSQTATAWAIALRDSIWEKRADDVRNVSGQWHWLAAGWKPIFDKKKRTFETTSERQVKRAKTDFSPEKAKFVAANRGDFWTRNAKKKAVDEAMRRAIYNNLLDGLKGLNFAP